MKGQAMSSPHFPKRMCTTAVGSLALFMLLSAQASAQKQPSTSDKAAIIARGEYLAQAGDCVACHTAPGGKLFAGGRAMPTPFGTLYTSNVTPDVDTGIGKWTADQFYSMIHTGRFPDGGLLYPAMPFGSYTKITRADSDAIFAFLRSVPAVKLPNRPHDLRFPYNNRSLIIGWRTLFFTEGEYKPDATKSDEWNRGAYLVQGLGHCAMCHTAINALGGSSESAAFEGGLIPMQSWYAPSLTSSKEGGLGDWSIDDISDLLRTGISKRGAVYGPMAEVTYNSLQYMTEADTRAMAVRRGFGAGRAASDHLGGRKQPAAPARPDHLRRQVRQLSRRQGPGKAARLSPARQQSIHRNVVGGESGADGSQWRLSAGDNIQSDAAWHAAVRPIAFG
jgi:mono/diheme cytochrome c family protein